MKFSKVLLCVLFAVGTTDAVNLRPQSRALMTLEEANAALDSDHCAYLMAPFEEQVEELMGLTESTLQSYMCNPYERTKLREAEESIVTALAGADLTHCQTALGTVFAENRHTITTALSSSSSCREEVALERAAFQAAGAHNRKLTTSNCGSCTVGVAGAQNAMGGTQSIADKGSRRRHLKLQASLDYEDIDDVMHACNKEEYDLSMYIEPNREGGNPHINMVATPLDSNKDECREALVFDDYDLGERLISYAADLGFGDDWHENAHPLGIFALGQMKAAADSASVVEPFKFDAMTNNCATFVIDMMGFLKIPITKEVKHYVVNSLVSNGNYVEAVGGSVEAMFGPDGKPLEEHKEKMWNFVSKYIEDHQQEL